MGLHLFALLFSSFLLTACFQKSSFGEKGLTVTEGDNDPGDSVDDDPVETDTTGISSPSISPTGSPPASSFYPIITGNAASNVTKVFVYINGCSNLASLRNGTLIDPVDGIDVDAFENGGLELDLSSMSSNTRIRIYLKTLKTNGSFSNCVEKYTYYHNINSPISFAAFSTKANPTAADWTTTSLLSGNLTNPQIKLQVNDENVETIQLFKSSTSCNSSSCACVTANALSVAAPKNDYINAGVALDFSQSTAPVKIFVKGFGADSFTTSCKEIASYQVDTVRPSDISDLRVEAISTHRKSPPPISWTATDNTGGSGIKHYLYYVTDNSAGLSSPTWNQTNNNTNLTLNISPDLNLNTSYYFFVKAVDKAGNESQNTARATWTVHSDTNLPVFAITAPSGSVTAQNINVTGTCIPNLPVKLSAESLGVLPQQGIETACSSAGTFSLPIKFTNVTEHNGIAQFIGESPNILISYLNSTSIARNAEIVGTKKIKITQFNGKVDVALERSIEFNPLSMHGLKLAASADHTCAMKNNELFCWGKADNGQLGLGENTINTVQPKKPSRGGWSASTFYDQVDVGENHTCALNTDKRVLCWGKNDSGQTGKPANSPASLPSPYDVSGNLTYKQITVGANHTCGITAVLNEVYCWGSNSQRQLGDLAVGTNNRPYTSSHVPVKVVFGNGTKKAIQIDAGKDYTCAVVQGNELYCWGNQQYGKLGNSAFANTGLATPSIVNEIELIPEEYFVYVSAANHHTCGLTSMGNIRCWGKSQSGSLGYNTASNQYTYPPSDPVNIFVPNDNQIKFRAVSAGGSSVTVALQNTCGISTSGKLYCWGSNAGGKLGVNRVDSGTNSLAQSLVPVEVSTVGIANANFQAVSVGGAHICASTADNKVYCWGLKNGEVLGSTSDLTKQLIPKEVSNWQN